MRASAGLSTGYTGCVWNVVDKDTRAIHSKSFLTFIPVNAVGRCNYLNRSNLKLYGSLEAGVMLSVGGDSLDLTFDAQLNPIGVEFGKTVFGMVEAGVGMNNFGGRHAARSHQAKPHSHPDGRHAQRILIICFGLIGFAH